MFSGFKSVPKVPSGNLLKPSLVGAKTVNGPSDESASTNSPACTAATKVEKLSFETAVSTIFLSLTLDDNTRLKIEYLRKLINLFYLNKMSSKSLILIQLSKRYISV